MQKKNSVYYLTISLLDIEPAIWRKFAVSGDIKLAELHEVIQIVMGWLGGHLHSFRIDDTYYSLPASNGDVLDDNDKNEMEAVLSDVVETSGTDFGYMYDFGDDWDHILTVEKISLPEQGVKYPVCLGGERSCPPEDCGGPLGYMHFLEAILNPHHEEHDELLEWAGGSFDPEEFDLSAINDQLAELVKNGMRRWDSDLYH